MDDCTAEKIDPPLVHTCWLPAGHEELEHHCADGYDCHERWTDEVTRTDPHDGQMEPPC